MIKEFTLQGGSVLGCARVCKGRGGGEKTAKKRERITCIKANIHTKGLKKMPKIVQLHCS